MSTLAETPSFAPATFTSVRMAWAVRPRRPMTRPMSSGATCRFRRSPPRRSSVSITTESGSFDSERASHPVLVFTDVDRKLGRDRCMGLVVDEIVDVVEEQLKIELTGDRPGLLGTAVIAGHATDVVDIGYWLTQAFHDWFVGSRDSNEQAAARILVVEDSDFFRHLLVPALSAAGYEVNTAPDAMQALRLRDAGMMFDAILSDIEMPEIDGNEFVRRIRAGGPWMALPVIALTGHGSAAAIESGRAAGFTDYVQKFERDTLLASLRQCLAARADVRMAA